MRVGSQDFSVCDTRGGLGSSCLWPGSAAQPCTPAAPACQPQFPARPAYLSLISASLLPRRASYLQARPDASPSRFEVSVLRICCSRRCPGDGVFPPVPGQRAPHVGWLMGLGGISVIDGSKALLREWSLFLQKSSHLGEGTRLGMMCPAPHPAAVLELKGDWMGPLALQIIPPYSQEESL